ncbi:MAG: hypothetical protein KBA81_02985 [Rhabdochlamydiaceae bacterium]|nr:hypothetical protein [Rhabdochlamydiaceae bacterium]
MSGFGNDISGLGFKTAVIQFGNASYQLLSATAKLPFSGGWKWMVFTGPPVLLLASGVGAVIFTIMKKSIRIAGSSISQNANKIIKNFYGHRVVHPNPHPHHGQVDASQLWHLFQNIPRPPSPNPINAPDPRRPLAPLPVDAAKERNKSLLKLLSLVEKLVIDPLMQKKEVLFGVTYTVEELKAWLMSMTLWRLGVAWDELENQYVQMQTPPPPTVESIIDQAKQVDAEMGKVFEENVQVPDGLVKILSAISFGSLSERKKIALVALFFKLPDLLKESRLDGDDKTQEEQEIRKKFALTMHHGMAHTLTHMVDIIEGWLVVWGVSPKALIPTLSMPAGPPSEERDENSEFSELVRGSFSKVEEDLREKYLIPLWSKKRGEWGTALQKNLEGHSETARALCKNFISGNMIEKEFLEASQEHAFSTSQTSLIFFMRAIEWMGRDEGKFRATTRSILGTVLGQLEPTIIDTLAKTAEMLSQVSFERSVPKVVDYFIELLKCCTTMQTVQQSAPPLNGSFVLVDGKSPFIGALERSGLEESVLSQMDGLYREISLQISGKVIIEKLTPGSVHKTVRQSFDSPLYEEGWIRVTKERLKTVLRLRAEKYAQEEGNWLSNLFKTSSNGSSTNLLTTFRAFYAKLQEIPGLEGVMTFLFSGIEAVIADKGVEATQAFLNECTSTGYLSTTIATSLVSNLIYKEEAKWNENLKILQQAFQFLQPDEQEIVLKYLHVICDQETYERREAELKNISSSNLNEQIEKMKARENAYKKAVEQSSEALKRLGKNQNEEDFALVIEGLAKLKREKELQQFERVRTLVIFVADKFLAFNFTGGEALKGICIRVIHEALTLLTFQEIVKHWIFTIVDLVIDELEESSHPKPIVEGAEPEKAVSLLDLIIGEQRQRLLSSLANMMETAETDRGWMSTRAWMTWGIRQASNWSSATIWGYIEQYRAKAIMTPLDLRNKVVEWVGDYGRDPNGLSDVIIQSLTEYVADPRPVRV